MAGKTELGKPRKSRKPRTLKKRSADDTMKSIQGRWLSGRTLSDQDISSIAAAVGSMMENPSGRFPTSLGEEAKKRSDAKRKSDPTGIKRFLSKPFKDKWTAIKSDRAKKRAGRTVSDQDKVFGQGVGFKKGGPAKKRAKGGRAKK